VSGSERQGHQAVTELLSLATPYTVKLCEADQSSKQCKPGEEGISARGIGGLFLPLALHVRGFVVKQHCDTSAPQFLLQLGAGWQRDRQR
jgi:hypothetical protein